MAKAPGMDVDGTIREMDPENLWKPLVLRFGEQAVGYWVQLLTSVQPLLLGSLVATSRARGEAVMPDAVLLVLRFPSDNPEGAVGTVGWSLLGPADDGMKQAVLARALDQFATHGDMFPQAGGWEKPPVSQPQEVVGEEDTLTGVPAIGDDSGGGVES